MYIIGISACPTGIAHTYMAADAIEHAAANIGADFKVETQGSIGIENRLNGSDIEKADLIVAVREFNRFDNAKNKIFEISLTDVITSGDDLIKKEMEKRGIH